LSSQIKKRDHRVIGKTQKLFMMHAASPGSVFMLPHGTRICQRVRPQRSALPIHRDGAR